MKNHETQLNKHETPLTNHDTNILNFANILLIGESAQQMARMVCTCTADPRADIIPLIGAPSQDRTGMISSGPRAHIMVT